MEMDPNPSPLDQFTCLPRLRSTSSPAAAAAAIQLCCCRRHPNLLLAATTAATTSLLLSAFAILEGTPCWAFHHQQEGV
jgi:hypothetical protein